MTKGDEIIPLIDIMIPLTGGTYNIIKGLIYIVDKIIYDENNIAHIFYIKPSNSDDINLLDGFGNKILNGIYISNKDLKYFDYTTLPRIKKINKIRNASKM